jgi:cytochrome c5
MSLTTGCSDEQPSTPQKTKSTATPTLQEAEKETTPSTVTPEHVAAMPGTEASDGDGKSVYQMACKVCHDAGVANAPKLGDSAAWAPRIKKGADAMFESIKNGLNAMPPKGACMSCSDTELRNAMEYMVSQSS